MLIVANRPLIFAIMSLLFFCQACTDQNPPSMMPEELQASQKRIEQAKSLAKAKQEAFDNKLTELENLKAPVRLADPVYLKAKSVAVGREPQGSSLRFSDGTMLSSEETAHTVKEIKSAVQIICRKGPRVGTYHVQLAKRPMPAYAVNCEVSIIDTTIPAIVGRKIFSNRDIPAELDVPFGGRTEYIAAKPLDAIKMYVQKLARK